MLTVSHKAVDAVDLESWVRTAAPGQAALYHEGFLANDRQANSLKDLKAMQVNALALMADKLATNGFVHLVQRRIDAEHYQYIAILSSKSGSGKPVPVEALAA